MDSRLEVKNMDSLDTTMNNSARQGGPNDHQDLCKLFTVFILIYDMQVEVGVLYKPNDEWHLSRFRLLTVLCIWNKDVF